MSYYYGAKVAISTILKPLWKYATPTIKNNIIQVAAKILAT